jgi:hypothetical protein
MGNLHLLVDAVSLKIDEELVKRNLNMERLRSGTLCAHKVR